MATCNNCRGIGTFITTTTSTAITNDKNHETMRTAERTRTTVTCTPCNGSGTVADNSPHATT